MVERILRGTSFLEDITRTTRAGLQAGVAGLSFLGLQYINQNYLDNAVPLRIDTHANITFSQLSFYVTDVAFLGATAFESLRTVYNVINIPVKAFRGHYSKKHRIVDK